MNNSMIPMDNFSNVNPERQYPELYNQVKPYIDDAVRRFRSGEYDEGMLESIIQDILERSGLAQYMTPPPADEEAIPAQRIMPYGRRNQNWGQGWGWNAPWRRHRRPMRPWYPTYPYQQGYFWGGFSPQDFVRLLLIRRLWG